MSSLKPLVLVLSLGASPACGQSEVEQGQLLVESNCSRCHAIGPSDTSPHPDALPFRRLSERYPMDSLAETLERGIPIEHPDMPDFLVTASQIDEITAYILSLQPR